MLTCVVDDVVDEVEAVLSEPHSSEDVLHLGDLVVILIFEGVEHHEFELLVVLELRIVESVENSLKSA